MGHDSAATAPNAHIGRNCRSCWVVIHNNVYDVTEFLPVRSASRIGVLYADIMILQEHPGGAAIILRYAGGDATEVYDQIHAPDALNKFLPGEKHLGPVQPEAAQQLTEGRIARKKTKDEVRVEEAHKKKPPLSHILSLAAMEVGHCTLNSSKQHNLAPRKLLVRCSHTKHGLTTRRPRTIRSVRFSSLLSPRSRTNFP